MYKNIVDLALQWMRSAHRSIDQRRKHSGLPYEVHPEDVVRRVKAAGENEITQAGAAIHDVFEDVSKKNPKYSVEEARKILGDEVVNLALEVTDIYTKEAYPDLNRRKRHALETIRLSKISPRGKSIKLADIASNTTGCVDADYSFASFYVREKVHVLPVLKDGNPILFKEANDTIYKELSKL